MSKIAYSYLPIVMIHLNMTPLAPCSNSKKAEEALQNYYDRRLSDSVPQAGVFYIVQKFVLNDTKAEDKPIDVKIFNEYMIECDISQIAVSSGYHESIIKIKTNYVKELT